MAKAARLLALALLLPLAGSAAGATSRLASNTEASTACARIRQQDPLLDRMIGQMIMVGFPGATEKDFGVIAVRRQLADRLVGGVVLYPENIHSPRQLRLLTAYLANANSKLVPFIAVDQEGGMVQRLRPWKGFGSFPSARSVGADPEFAKPEEAHQLYSRMARELASVGINVNFGPVVDLSANPGNPVVVRRKRSFAEDPDTVTKLASAFIAAHRDANVATTPKHFPGHGSSWTDSHKSLPNISQTWRERELEPYVDLAKEGLLDAVMVGHLYHPRFSDGVGVPASLSKRAMRALRAKGYIGFNGVVVSDDMQMDAVANRFSFEDRIVMAVNAGIDLLVFSNVEARDPELGVKVHEVISEAVQDGRIDRLRIEQAYGKIVLLKRRLMLRDLPGNW